MRQIFFEIVLFQDHPMGKKLEVRSGAEVQSTADALLKAAGRLVAVAQGMKTRNMENIALYWAQRQWTAIDIVLELGKDADLMSESQFLSHDQGRKSAYMLTMERTSRDAEKKRKRVAGNTAETAPLVKKPRGRPKKT